jgi:hypothetical protein
MDHNKSVPCKYCGKKINFIKKGNYTWIAVESKLIVVKEDDEKLKLILSDGTIKIGMKKGECGHERHRCGGK